MTLEKIVIIAGPTASGKSALAVDIAGRIGGRIVSADSAAVYRYLDIGTAKPSQEQRALVPHHLIDLVNPDQQFDAMAYVRAADSAIADIGAAGGVPIVVGGTGLYIKALVFGIFDQPEPPRGRGAIRTELSALPTDLLRGELERVDPASAARIGKNDRVRLIRALEIYRLTGIPKSEHETRHGFAERRYDAVTFGLSVERELLNERIGVRVDEMIARGIFGEVEEVLAMGYGPGSPGLATIGYREIVEYLAGHIDREEAVFLIKRNTRRYAKRQMTWFRRMEGIRWVEYPYDADLIAAEIGRFLSTA
jgi:tRNA dimethylallyltransferase